MRLRLHAHQEAVEGRDVDADRVVPALERLDESRPGAGERIEHPPARRDVASKKLFDELRDVLPEVGVQAVNVLRAQPLGQLVLGPRQSGVVLEALVE